MTFEENWDQTLIETQRRRSQRVPLMCCIRYHASDAYDTEEVSGFADGAMLEGREGEALSINIGSGGMLLMMNWDPEVSRVMKVEVPTPVNLAKTPTLAQVRWKQRIPYSERDMLYFVGLQSVL